MDDLSTFIQLHPSPQATTDTVVTALCHWSSSFGIPSIWVSDCGSHFKNVIMSELAERLQIRHHFTMAAMHFPNGTIERMCQIVSELFRLLFSELRMVLNRWPELLQLVQFVANHTVRPSLGRFAPVTVFTGLAAASPLDAVIPTLITDFPSHRLDPAQIRESILAIIPTPESMHKEVATTRDRNRRRSRPRKLALPNFMTGDFVLWGRRE